MAWSESRIFRSFIADALGNTAPFALGAAGDALKVALFNNTITPDRDVASALAKYAAGQYVPGGEVINTAGGASQWDAGGKLLSTVTLTALAGGVVMLDAADTASGSATTLTDVYGGLVYDDQLTAPVADQALSYNFFGGAQSVTNGTFTVVWAANGILRLTV